jgi:zinc protease
MESERRETVSDEPIPLPAIFYGYRVPQEDSREFFALDLLCGILASGESSRLYQTLVYDRQIASETAAYVDAREMPGLLYLYAIASDPELGTNELELVVNDILQNIIEEGIRPEELQKARNKSESIIVASRLTVEGKADQLAHAALMFGDANRVNTLLDEYSSISSEEVHQVAKKYLRQENRVALVYHKTST